MSDLAKAVSYALPIGSGRTANELAARCCRGLGRGEKMDTYAFERHRRSQQQHRQLDLQSTAIAPLAVR